MNKLSTLTVAVTAIIVVSGHVAGVFALQQSDTAATGDKVPAESAAAVTESDPQATEILRQSRNRLFERQSVQAEITQLISLGEYRLQSRGTYASGTGFRYRLQYQLQLGDLQGEFLEVCDGQILHTRRQITPISPKHQDVAAPEMELTRRDIQRIRREALGIKDANPTSNLSDALRSAEIGLGGIPAILAMLERTLLLEPARVQNLDGRNFLVLQGRMRPDRQAELLAGLGPASGQIAGFLPDVVRLYLDQETLFPEKFLYLKLTEPNGKTLAPLITVEFTNVQLDQPIQEKQFVYMAPPGLEEKDETLVYLEMMRQAAAAVVTPAEQSPPAGATPPPAQ